MVSQTQMLSSAVVTLSLAIDRLQTDIANRNPMYVWLAELAQLQSESPLIFVVYRWIGSASWLTTCTVHGTPMS